MKQIVLTITAKAPLAIGQRKPGGSVSEAMDYIPGTVIRGAIAAGILQQAQQAPEPGDQFHALLVDETAAIFQNAYPAIGQSGDDHYEVCTGDIRLLPATALSAKNNSGFRSKGSGVFDALIDSFCAREHGHFYQPNDLAGDRVEPFKGFYSQQGEHYCSHSISKRLLTRVGINCRRATAEENILYSLEVLNETQGKTSPQPSIYRSAILVADDLADPLHQFIRQNEHSFRLGGSNSRGLGHVHIQTELQDSLVDAEAIKNRVEQFTDKLRERWSQWSVFNSSKQMPDKTYFTLDLQSDAILTENWRRTMVISAEMLSQFAHIDPPINDSILKLEMAYSSYDYRSGWNAAWGLCKDVELVTKMGSVFLFSTNNPEQWCEPLARLEQRGVGDRTSEGYGQIKVCDDFHQIFREEPA